VVGDGTADYAAANDDSVGSGLHGCGFLFLVNGFLALYLIWKRKS